MAARRRCRQGTTEVSVPFEGWFDWEDRVVRVSTCPYATGDALVLRVLEGTPQERRLEDLGLSDPDAARVRTWLADGHGLVIVAGVRGSGRSATLSALLSEIDRERGRVSTVGDGPGILVPGVGRVRLRPEEGFGRAEALRTLMRQDLDAVAVTDVSDPDTLSEAVAVALAGHLVIVSLDADGAPGALLGMIEAGVNPKILAETVRGVLVQRLLRSADGTDWVPVFEIMGMTNRVREALRKDPTATGLARAATADGINTLAQVAATMVEEGLLARREVERVLGE
jgi:type II secretory ATPase GspE/PulE/Tfp pilus assembly ATPase PilB-like protein